MRPAIWTRGTCLGATTMSRSVSPDLRLARKHSWDANATRIAELAAKRDKRIANKWDIERAWEAFETAKAASDERMWAEIAEGGSVPVE